MKQKLYYLIFIPLCIMVTVLPSCREEEDRPTFPLSAEIFHSIAGRQVAFTALTHSAERWEWNFGDGKTSNEKNPVHVYDVGGYYVATLTAWDHAGQSKSKEVKLAIELTPYALLTGDHTAADYKGKTWKLSADHSTAGDYLANADASLSVVAKTPKPLPTGIFSTEFGMGAIYDDEYTFYHDGRYSQDVKADGGAFGGMVYQMLLNGGKDIINSNGKSYGLCIAKYTPEANATFTFTEKEDIKVPSAFGQGGELHFKDVSTLDFSGTAFIGFRDFQKKVIVTKITDSRMQLIMFMAASAPHVPLNTHALILSFEVVK